MREQKGLTLAQLENITGISAQQLNRLEKGERRLNQDNLSVIAQAFSCEPSDLIETRQKRLSVDADKEAYIIFRQIIKKRKDLHPEQEFRLLKAIQQIVSDEISAHGSSSLSLAAAENILNALLDNAAKKGDTL